MVVLMHPLMYSSTFRCVTLCFDDDIKKLQIQVIAAKTARLCYQHHSYDYTVVAPGDPPYLYDAATLKCSRGRQFWTFVKTHWHIPKECYSLVNSRSDSPRDHDHHQPAPVLFRYKYEREYHEDVISWFLLGWRWGRGWGFGRLWEDKNDMIHDVLALETALYTAH